MQIIRQNYRQGEVVVKIDNPEDLWTLSQVLDSDDIVSGKTERKIKIGAEGDRKQAVVRKTVFIALKVEKVEFHKYSDNLRVSGIIIEGPEDVPRGSHHTFDVEQGTVLTIKKTEFPNYQIEKLDEATEAIKAKIIIVLFDREQAIFAMLKNQGYNILSKIKGDVAKKGLDAEGKKSFYADIVASLKEYDARYAPGSIIVASPSFWKEYLMKEMPPELKKKTTMASCSDVEEGAIMEVLARPELRKVLESERAAKELGLVEELLKAVAKDESCYGIKECKEKSEAGAVKELLVSYDFINKARQEDKHKEVEQVMRLAEKTGAKVTIISTEEAGKKVIGLGGIAGTLRWKQARS
jgi:protein pelota